MDRAERAERAERFWYWILFSERTRNQRCKGCCMLCRHYGMCSGNVRYAVLADHAADLVSHQHGVEAGDRTFVRAS